MTELGKEHFVASIIEEEREISCWGCGLRLILPSSAPVFKCGWCGAITNQNARKSDNKWFWWRRVRDRCFVCVLLAFILFVICGGVWAVYPVVFSISFVCGIFHIIVTICLSVTTISTFGLAAFRCAGKPPTIVWGSYPVVGKGGLQNYTFCRHCSRPKSPRTHHCRSCGMCVLDMDHHCPFIGNCVGAENHQHFIAFLISAVTSTTYAAVMCAYAGLQIAPPLKPRPNFRFQALSSETALSAFKDMILDWLGSVVLMSARGLILFYLFVSSISVATGLSVLLWQQLSYIYEGKTYLAHLSAQEGENAGDKDCNNVLRFLGCPYFVSRYLSNFQNSRKRHTK